MEEKIKKALELINNYGGIDGGHHKQWVLDQLIKILSDDYILWVGNYESGENGLQTCEWDTGIAP